jgi:hypothetical protein
MTSAIDAVVSTVAMTSFTAVKTVLGDYVCAIYPVAMTTILSISAIQCLFECQRVNSCGGFNFRDNDSICELIRDNNVVFGAKQGCKYFTVSKKANDCRFHVCMNYRPIYPHFALVGPTNQRSITTVYFFLNYLIISKEERSDKKRVITD